MSQINFFSDSSLLLQISEGDEHSFALLFEHYYRILRPAVLKFIKNQGDTEEILQETFVRVWLSRDKLPEIENMDAWIHRVASRECLTYFRKNRTRQPELANIDKYHHLSIARDTSPLELLGIDEMRRAIDQFVDRMPPQRRRIFRLSREEGLKPSEIAALLSLSVSTVKNTLSTSLKEIRNHLINNGFDHLPLLIIWYISSQK